VRWLGTDEVVKTEVRQDRAAYRREPAVGAWTNEWEGSSFIAAHCVGATWACARRERGKQQLDGRATGVLAHAARRNSDVAVAAALRGGVT
jgi:hypothetical protein